MALKNTYTRKYGTSQVDTFKGTQNQVFFLQAFESFMLIVLTISFFALKLIPNLSENGMLQKYLQFYTAFFVGYETVLKTYNFYLEYRDTKIDPKSFYTNPLFFKSLAFLAAFGISILGLLPVNISNQNSTFNLGSLILATGMATFPHKFVDIFFSKTISKKDGLLALLSGVSLLVGLVAYFVYEYNMMGSVLGAMLLMQGVSMGVDAWQKARKVEYEQIQNYWANLAIYLVQVGVVLSILGLYLKQVELGMPKELSFLSKLKNN